MIVKLYGIEHPLVQPYRRIAKPLVLLEADIALKLTKTNGKFGKLNPFVGDNKLHKMTTINEGSDLDSSSSSSDFDNYELKVLMTHDLSKVKSLLNDQTLYLMQQEEKDQTIRGLLIKIGKWKRYNRTQTELEQIDEILIKARAVNDTCCLMSTRQIDVSNQQSLVASEM